MRKCGELFKKTASIAPFNGNRYFVFQSGAPPGSVAQRTCWCLFLLHLFRFRVCQRRGAAHEDWSRDVAYSNYVASRRQLWGRQTTVTMWRLMCSNILWRTVSVPRSELSLVGDSLPSKFES